MDLLDLKVLRDPLVLKVLLELLALLELWDFMEREVRR